MHNSLCVQDIILLMVIIYCIEGGVTIKPRIEIFPQSGFAQENFTLRLVCSMESDNFLGHVSLIKNEKQIVTVVRCCNIEPTNDFGFNLSEYKIPKQTKQFSLSFVRQHVTKEDEGVYSCKWIDDEFATSSTDYVTVHVGSAPKDLNLQFFSGTDNINSSALNENSKFFVTCGAYGSNLTLTLFKDTVLLNSTTGSDKLIIQSPIYDMSIQENFNLVHSKEFRCTAINSWDTQESTQLVLIQYAPKLEGITLNGQANNKLTVQPGTKLICESSAYPTPTVYFDDTKYNMSQFKAEPNRVNEVTVLSVGERVETALICFASNEVKQVEKTFLITIDRIPVINSVDSSAKSSSSLVLTVGIAVAVLLLVLMAFIVIAVLCVRQRRQSHAKLKSNVSRRNNYEPVNSADCNPGSSKMFDIESEGSKGQAPAKPARPVVVTDPLEEELHYSTLTFNDQPGSRQPIVSTKPNSDASLLSVRLRKGPPPGSYPLPTPVPAGRHPAFQQPHQSPPLAGPVVNGYETEYSEIVGIHPYTSV